MLLILFLFSFLPSITWYTYSIQDGQPFKVYHHGTSRASFDTIVEVLRFQSLQINLFPFLFCFLSRCSHSNGIISV